MNWLIYLGGAFTIMYAWGSFVARMEFWCDSNLRYTNWEMFWLLITLASPIAVWIWICWRFIR